MVVGNNAKVHPGKRMRWKAAQKKDGTASYKRHYETLLAECLTVALPLLLVRLAEQFPVRFAAKKKATDKPLVEANLASEGKANR